MDDEDREVFEKRLGTVLRGKWRLDRLLGVGGMAAVYLATHQIGRQEAIKILHPEVARSKDLRARFEREAQAVNRFRHPGVVEIRDIDVTDDGAPFLVMELLEGESLADRAQREPGLDPGELLRLADDLLDVLAAAHAQGIIHRDIKPDNLFLTRDGRLKVLDFGIAHVRDGVRTELRTRAGSTLGTVSYMAPEQVRGVSVDQRADLFAVGATLFRIIARRRLHEARTESELLVKMATTPAPPLGSVAPGARPGVCMLVDRALAFDRDKRYPDARTMQEDVRAVRRGELPPFAASQLAPGDAAAAAASGRASVVAGGGAAMPVAVEPTAVHTGAGMEISLASVPSGPLSAAGALSAVPPTRVSSATAFTSADTIMAQGPAPVSAAAPLAPASKRPANMGVIIAAGGAVLTLLVIAGLWLALSGGDEASDPSSSSKPAPSASPTSKPIILKPGSTVEIKMK